jgi:hypothetical protein
MRCHVSWSVDTWIIRVFVSSLACSCNIRNWQRQPSVKGKIHAWIFWIVALWIPMSCISSRAMHRSCSRVEMSRNSALVMFFYMHLEEHVCNAMSIDLLFALAVVSFDHLITSTHSSDICGYLWSESESCRSSFARGFVSDSRRHSSFCDSCRIEGYPYLLRRRFLVDSRRHEGMFWFTLYLSLSISLRQSTAIRQRED